MRKQKEIRFLIIIALTVMLLLIICACWINRATTVYSAYEKDIKVTCFIIDAGHGGVDGGAISCTGIYESQINLEIAIRLNTLMQFLGYRTKMIRTENISVYTTGNTIAEKKISDLKERIRIINNTDKSIVLSIHQNYFQDNRYHGAQVFYGNGSEDLANLVQSNFINTINRGSSRKIKKATGIYLMNNILCKGILVECGFLSNPSEEQKLRDPEYQKKICCVIGCSAAQYVNNAQLA